MTEYDYSPDAYERYLAKQQSVARWVDHTRKQPLCSPETPPTPAVHAQRPLPPSHTKSRHKRSRSIPARPTHNRAYSTPEPYVSQYPANSHNNFSQYTLHQPHIPAHQGYSSRQFPTSSYSSLPTPGHRPSPNRSQSYIAPPTSPVAPRQPVRSRTADAAYTIVQPNGHRIIIPAGSGSYAYYPGHGGQVQRIDSPRSPADPPWVKYQKDDRGFLQRFVFGIFGSGKSKASSRSRSRRVRGDSF